jgi:hypothetical protein
MSQNTTILGSTPHEQRLLSVLEDILTALLETHVIEDLDELLEVEQEVIYEHAS